jgi:deoxyribonuclease V
MEHTWDLSPKEAVALQKRLRAEIVLEPFTKEIKYVGGCDVSLDLHSTDVFAGFVVLSYPDLEMVDHAVIEATVTFPYVPGLLSFREIPPLLTAWDRLTIKPDLVCVDGAGIAHPRRIGIASHLGLALDVPTIGISKSLLTGTYEQPDEAQGSSELLIDAHNADEVLGVALRTKEGVSPVFVSPGYKVTVHDAERLVKTFVKKHRIPEPTRLAHEMVNEYRKRKNAG